MFSSPKDAFKLRNGVEIPCVGFGTYLTPDGDTCVNSVKEALSAGYRHIDTAEFYANEESVGKALAESGISRDEVFVTTKLWNTNQGYDSALRHFDMSAKKLGLDTVDLYLIHWPMAKDFVADYPKTLLDTWRAFERLYEEGRVRAIGVCNCLKHHLKVIIDNSKVAPMVNQIEFHAGLVQKEAEEFSKQNGVVVEAWAPLCRGRTFGNTVLESIAAKHGKTQAQVLVRWCLDKGVLPLPKSVTPSRIRENINVFDFALSADEIAAIETIEGVGRIGSNPDDAKY